MGLAYLWGIADLHCQRSKIPRVKTQTESHIKGPVVWQIWVFFSFEVRQGTAGICHTGLWGFSEALQHWVSHSMTNPMFRIHSFIYEKVILAQGSILH